MTSLLFVWIKIEFLSLSIPLMTIEIPFEFMGIHGIYISSYRLHFVYL